MLCGIAADLRAFVIAAELVAVLRLRRLAVPEVIRDGAGGRPKACLQASKSFSAAVPDRLQPLLAKTWLLARSVPILTHFAVLIVETLPFPGHEQSQL